MLTAAAFLVAAVAGVLLYRWRQHKVRQQVIDAVRSAGLAMLCKEARKQSSIELKAKLSSGVLLGAYKDAAEQVLRERGEA